MSKHREINTVLHDPQRLKAAQKSLVGRHRQDRLFARVCVVISSICVVLLVVFLAAIVIQGTGTLTNHFLTSPPDPDASIAGFYPAIMGSIWLLVITAVVSLPIGVATAIMLEEFPPRSALMRRLHSLLQTNITNLAGVPSVVYGILGLTAFVSCFGLFGTELAPRFETGVQYYDQFFNESQRVILVPVEGPAAPETLPQQGLAALTADYDPITINVVGETDPWPSDAATGNFTLRETEFSGRISETSWRYFRLPLGRGILAGALTLMLVILPIIIISSQEALRAVPPSLREASFGMGATRWQTVWQITLPAAIPGIMTGAIIAISRAIGEAAPLLMIAGIVFITNPPNNLFSDFTAMPLQIYNWAQRPQSEFHAIAGSGIMVLLGVLLVFNAVAVTIRHQLQKPLS